MRASHGAQLALEAERLARVPEIAGPRLQAARRPKQLEPGIAQRVARISRRVTMLSASQLTSRVAARFPGVATPVRRAVWKARNLPRSLGYSADASTYDGELLAELVERGIAVRPFEAVFRERALLDRLVAVADRPDAQAGSTAKDFLTWLMPRAIPFDSPYVAPALEPQVVALANAYLGMRSYLRALDMWLNVPTDEPPKLSQLWHRDYDDVVNLKLFIYLTDVGEQHGPFTFAPGTHPQGSRTFAATERMTDDEMAAQVPREDWVVCTGPVGTVVFADTCGFHKGGKPTEGRRILWTAQFTSAAANYDRNFTLENGSPHRDLSRDQRAALFKGPKALFR